MQKQAQCARVKTQLLGFLVIPEDKAAHLDAHPRIALVYLILQRERGVHGTLGPAVVLRVEDLEDPRLLRRHVARVVPPLVGVVRHVGHLVHRRPLPVGRVLGAGLVPKVLGHVAVLAGAGRGEVGDDGAEVVLVDGTEVAQGQRVLQHGLLNGRPHVHDAPAPLHPPLGLLFRKVEKHDLFGAAIGLVHVDKSLYMRS